MTTDKEKLIYLKYILTENIDWATSFQMTFSEPPSGLTACEAKSVLAKFVLDGERPVVVMK